VPLSCLRVEEGLEIALDQIGARVYLLSVIVQSGNRVTARPSPRPSARPQNPALNGRISVQSSCRRRICEVRWWVSSSVGKNQAVPSADFTRTSDQESGPSGYTAGITGENSYLCAPLDIARTGTAPRIANLCSNGCFRKNDGISGAKLEPRRWKARQRRRLSIWGRGPRERLLLAAWVRLFFASLGLLGWDPHYYLRSLLGR